jgi:hypothetical protein
MKVTREQTSGAMKKVNSPLFEIPFVLVRFDHATRMIVNANHSIM